MQANALQPRRPIQRPEVALAALIVIGFAPLLFVFFRRLWLNEHYRYFPLVLAAAGWLIVERLEGRSRIAWWVVSGLLAVFWVVLAASAAVWSPWTAAIAAIGTTGALLLAAGKPNRAVFTAWLLLWLVIPLPFRWDESLILTLQRVSSKAGSYLLEFLSVDHLLTAHVIEIPGQRFLVEEACSGIRSLFLLVSLTAIVTVWTRRGLVHSLLLIVAAAGWATVANTLRVVSLVAADVWLGVDLSSGWRHETLGIAFIGFAALMLLCSDRFLLFLLDPITAPASRDEEQDSGQTAISPRRPKRHRRKNRSLRYPLVTGLCFSLLGLLQLAMLLRGESRFGTEPEAYVKVLRGVLDESSLPATQLGWQRVSHEEQVRDRDSILGQYSYNWTYQRPATLAIVSFDFPFLGWHPLLNCYRGQGWEVLDWTIHDDRGADGESGIPYVRARMRHPRGDEALLMFSEVDTRGLPLQPPPNTRWSWASFKQELLQRLAEPMAEIGLERTTCQFQVLANCRGEFTEANEQEIKQLFVDSRAMLLERFREAIGSERDGASRR